MSGKPKSSENLYQVLGVDPTASQSEIKQAYRKLALRWHPDKQRSEEDEKDANEVFHRITEAFSILGDEEKRREYDYKLHSGNSNQTYAFPGGTVNAQDIFNAFFRGSGLFDSQHVFNNERRHTGVTKRLRTTISVSLEESICGCDKKLSLSYGDGHHSELSVPVPPGIQHGQVMRVSFTRNLGEASLLQSDWLVDITVRILRHPEFKLEGMFDLITVRTVSLVDALLGHQAVIRFISDDGEIELEQVQLNPFEKTVKYIVLPGKGRTKQWVSSTPGKPSLVRGDLIVELQVEMPSTVRDWSSAEADQLKSLLNGAAESQSSSTAIHEASEQGASTNTPEENMKCRRDSTQVNAQTRSLKGTNKTNGAKDTGIWKRFVNWLWKGNQKRPVKLRSKL